MLSRGVKGGSTVQGEGVLSRGRGCCPGGRGAVQGEVLSIKGSDITPPCGQND